MECNTRRATSATRQKLNGEANPFEPTKQPALPRKPKTPFPPNRLLRPSRYSAVKFLWDHEWAQNQLITESHYLCGCVQGGHGFCCPKYPCDTRNPLDHSIDTEEPMIDKFEGLDLIGHELHVELHSNAYRGNNGIFCLIPYWQSNKDGLCYTPDEIAFQVGEYAPAKVDPALNVKIPIANLIASMKKLALEEVKMYPRNLKAFHARDLMEVGKIVPAGHKLMIDYDFAKPDVSVWGTLSSPMSQGSELPTQHQAGATMDQSAMSAPELDTSQPSHPPCQSEEDNIAPGKLPQGSEETNEVMQLQEQDIKGEGKELKVTCDQTTQSQEEGAALDKSVDVSKEEPVSKPNKEPPSASRPQMGDGRIANPQQLKLTENILARNDRNGVVHRLRGAPTAPRSMINNPPQYLNGQHKNGEKWWNPANPPQQSHSHPMHAKRHWRGPKYQEDKGDDSRRDKN